MTNERTNEQSAMVDKTDPYVSISLFKDKGEEIQGRTAVVEGTTDPNFAAEHPEKVQVTVYVGTTERQDARHEQLMVTVYDDDPLGEPEFMGRALIPKAVVAAAAESPGGIRNDDITLELTDEPNARRKLAQGNITLRVDPYDAAPTAADLTAMAVIDDETALAALEQYQAKAAVGADEAQELASAVAEAADETQVGTVEATMAEAEEHARLLEEEAEQKAVEDTEKDQGDDLAMEVTGTLAEVLPDADPRELKWPVTDVFVADAMSEYVEVLEGVGIPDKQLKRYHNYMRESVMFGEGAKREKAAEWMAREAATTAAFQKELAAGAGVAEAEQRILAGRNAKWHPDMAGAIIEMPTNTRQVQWHSVGGVATQEQVIGPYAPSFPTPSVLDTPRTRLQLAAEANRLRAEAHAALRARLGEVRVHLVIPPVTCFPVHE